jgi:hypothetical protein
MDRVGLGGRGRRREWRFEPEEFREAGDFVVVSVRASMFGRGSTKPVEGRLFHVIEVSEGRLQAESAATLIAEASVITPTPGVHPSSPPGSWDTSWGHGRNQATPYNAETPAFAGASGIAGADYEHLSPTVAYRIVEVIELR